MNPPHPKRTTATAADICEVPGVTIRKMCKPQDASGDSELDFTVTNTGGTGLTNCVITDNIFPTDATWTRIETWVARAVAAGERFGFADLLIGAIAADQGAALWSLDTEFDRLARLRLVEAYMPR